MRHFDLCILGSGSANGIPDYDVNGNGITDEVADRTVDLGAGHHLPGKATDRHGERICWAPVCPAHGGRRCGAGAAPGERPVALSKCDALVGLRGGAAGPWRMVSRHSLRSARWRPLLPLAHRPGLGMWVPLEA